MDTGFCTETVEAKPQTRIEVLINKTRECLLESEDRYFEAGDLVNELADPPYCLELATISKRLGISWKKSFLSKLGTVSAKFSVDDRAAARELGACWDDCYRSLRDRGSTIDNLKALLSNKQEKKAKKIDEIERYLIDGAKSTACAPWQRGTYRRARKIYSRARKIQALYEGLDSTGRWEIQKWIDGWLSVSPDQRKSAQKTVEDWFRQKSPPQA